MTTPARTSEPRRFFVGWRVLLFGIITTALSSPGQTIAVSVFIPDLITDLGLDDSQVSFAYLLGTIGGGLFLPFIGRWIDRNGAKKALLIIASAFGVALIAMGQVRSFPFLILGFFSIRLLGQGSVPLISNVAVTHWFDKRRGVIMGVLSAASGALMALSPVAFNAVIEQWGWRVAWPLSGVVIWLVLIPISRWGLVNRPSDVGQVPDGRGWNREADGESVGLSMTRSQAVRTFRYWVLVAIGAAVAMLSTALNFYQLDLLGQAGLTRGEAALMFVPQTYGAIVIGLLFGFLADKFPARILVPTSMVMLAAALGMASIVAPGFIVITYALFLGSAAAAVRSINSTVLPRWFGTDHIGAIRGLSGSIGVFASALGPFVFSLLRAELGGYSRVAALGAAIPLAIMVAGLFLPSRQKAAELLVANGS